MTISRSNLGVAMARYIALAGLALFGFAMAPDDAHAGSISCTVASVADLGNRVHIQCVNSVRDPATGANIFFFAVPTTNTALSGRLLTIGSAGLVANRRVLISFTDGDISGMAFGCLSGNCRRPTSLVTQ